MLFMGEEWNASQPFPFFCDFGPELAEAVRKGRRAEFPEHSGNIPDPLACETFLSAKLHWEDRAAPEHAAWLAWYERILKVRRSMRRPTQAGSFDVLARGALVVSWLPDGLTLAANLSGATVSGFPPPPDQVLWQEGEAGTDGRFGAWTVRWSQ
jgi:Domain of unknown function (DUF3459)